jgi:selenocysteine lyase/cysteine desulfurase
MGIGVSYVGARLFEQLRPSSIGTESVVKDHEYFDYDLTLKPTARRFEDASPNLPGILGLGAALNLLVRAGLARVPAGRPRRQARRALGHRVVPSSTDGAR